MRSAISSGASTMVPLILPSDAGPYRKEIDLVEYPPLADKFFLEITNNACQVFDLRKLLNISFDIILVFCLHFLQIDSNNTPGRIPTLFYRLTIQHVKKEPLCVMFWYVFSMIDRHEGIRIIPRA